jgi:hypothetical protein
MTELIPAYAALMLSILLAWERIARQAKDKTEEKLGNLRQEIDSLKALQNRVEGAALFERIGIVEERQRSDETTLVRVDERLENVSSILANIVEEIKDNR